MLCLVGAPTKRTDWSKEQSKLKMSQYQYPPLNRIRPAKAMWGFKAKTVRSSLNRYNGNSDPRAGNSSNMIGDLLGVEASTIWQTLRRGGLEMRDCHGRQKYGVSVVQTVGPKALIHRHGLATVYLLDLL